jgi:hypothetical protein
MMDGNGDSMSGPLKDLERNLGLKNTILSHNSTLTPPATHKRGTQAIDMVLSSPELVILAVAFLAGKDSLGDHRVAIVNFQEDTVIRENLLKIIRPQARRLVCGLPEVRKKYLAILNKALHHHKVRKKLYDVQEV